MQENNIHPTAIIGKDVKIGTGNTIGPNVVMDGQIVIGNNNRIGVGTIMYNYITVGDNNVFTGYASIGLEGEMGAKGDVIQDDGCVVIGNNNKFREFVTIHSPVKRKETRIGDKCYLMARVYIAHDCQVGTGVNMAAGSVLAGGCTIEDFAYLGSGSMVHQWTEIGESAMIGMLTFINKPILPFSVVAGAPSRLLRFNKLGAERRGFSAEHIEEANTSFADILLGKHTKNNPIADTIKRFDEKYQHTLKKFYESK